jgi:hypothetical protein
MGALNHDDGIPLCGVIYLSDVITDCDVQLNDKVVLIHQARHYAAMKEFTQQPVRQVLVHQISNMVSSAVKRHVVGQTGEPGASFDRCKFFIGQWFEWSGFGPHTQGT